MDTQQRNALVLQYYPMVHRWAYRYSDYFAPKEDLLQEGLIGLISAAERFKEGAGVYFPVYAKQHVRGAILRYLRDKAHAVRYPRGSQKKILSLNASTEASEWIDSIAAPEVEEEPSYDHVLEKLTLKQKYIFQQYFLLRHSAADIAKGKRVPPTVIHRQIRAIREKFKIYL